MILDSQSAAAQQPTSQPQDELMKKLLEHANKAVAFSSVELKQRVAVPSPQGGFRMEVQVLKTR